ncbi:hypothetical protein FOA43_003393 [Brettanomyces nanus]|uniref:CST complex subunit Stn1 N-terminal domain-containing protein n=1 Tax=Eeniella nana TaxID=13502 RepID=A0A875RW30_EENNA|nr:uncharacterized protein FOA43_003393 [Brettanomyces nanus]QPG76007.1 hypothetical protein FOA43_003393 [Brettanomyces nanus]
MPGNGRASEERAIKRAEEKLKVNCHRDFAPGNNRIKFRQDGVNYYVPNIFHTANTLRYKESGGYMPIFIKDILKIKDTREIYHTDGYEAAAKGITLYGNHPLKNICIMGRIVSEKFRESEFMDKTGDMKQKITYFMEMTDSSTDETIQVKVDRMQYLLNHLRLDHNYDILLKVRGNAAFYYNFSNPGPSNLRSIELHADTVQVVGDKCDIRVELEWWDIVMTVRKGYLLKPWIFDEEDLVRVAREEAEVETQNETQEEQSQEEHSAVKKTKGSSADACKSTRTTLSEAITAAETESKPCLNEGSNKSRLLGIELEFLSFLIRNAGDRDACIPIRHIYQDKQLIYGFEQILSLTDSSDLQIIYDWLLAKFCNTRIIRMAESNEKIEIINFQRIFRYVKNLIGFLTNNQEKGIKRLLARAGTSQKSDDVYKMIEYGLSQEIRLTIDLKSLEIEICHRFNLKHIKVEYLNKLVDSLIRGNYIVKGGIGMRQFTCKTGFRIILRWVYDANGLVWSYISRLKSS